LFVLLILVKLMTSRFKLYLKQRIFFNPRCCVSQKETTKCYGTISAIGLSMFAFFSGVVLLMSIYICICVCWYYVTGCSYQMMFVSFNSSTTGVNNGSEAVSLSGILEFPPPPPVLVGSCTILSFLLSIDPFWSL